MIQDTMHNIINAIWPLIIIVVVVLTSFRIMDILIHKRKIILYKDLITLLFIIYIICLFYIVTFQDVNYGTSNFIPFKEINRYTFLSRLFIKNVMGNVILFIPFGFFSSYFLKTKKILPSTILTIITSITIEIVQLKIGRVFDIDDIILNIIGGLIGYLLYILLNYIKKIIPNFLKKEYLINIILSILIIISLYIILYISQINLL